MRGSYFYGIFDLIGSLLPVFIVISVFCAAYCMNRAQESGKKMGTYFALGFLLGPIGVKIAKVKCDK